MVRVILFVVSTFKQQQHLLVKRRSRRYPLAGPLLTSNHADGRSVYQAVSWSPLLAAYAVVTLVLCSARGWVTGVNNPLQLLSGCGASSSSPLHHPLHSLFRLFASAGRPSLNLRRNILLMLFNRFLLSIKESLITFLNVLFCQNFVEKA